ncbi:hypothetical protein V5O48_005398 [Marasmius crinis-equi]|uniref:DUF7702 domain-containing protein n=1 Tax=Marasmius crinis-equi TaxID=585013 RepID=A0ABR3FMC5_9AGAR
MAPLSLRGKIAAAEVAFWVPPAIFTLVLVIRYAFRKDAGWFFLFIFSLTRITAGALGIVIDTNTSPSMQSDMFLAEIILFSAGLALLFLSAIGFLGLAGQHQYSEYRQMSRYFRGFAIFPIIAMAFCIAGNILGSHVSPDSANAGLILRRIAAGIYGATYLLLFLLAGKCWTYRYYLKRHRKRLLAGTTFGLLFLGVRVAYAILDAWSASDQFGIALSSDPTLAQFNSISGDYIPYLVMGLVMEYLTALTFLLSSTVIMQRR